MAQGLKPDVTYFRTRTPAMRLIYMSCGVRWDWLLAEKSSVAELPLNLT
jgi:hypothetical protein